MSLVALSGVPGSTSTYQHEDLFDIDWDAFEQDDEIAITQHVGIDDAPRLSAREAAALIAGLQYLQALPENADSAALKTLVAKLSRGASAEPSQLAVAGGGDDDVLLLVRQAVADGHRLRFGYLNSRGELEERDVDPLRVESIDADWYLRGWCHLRQALRTFRFDRMSDVRQTELPIEHTAAEVRLPDTLFEPSDEDLEVTIEASPEVIGCSPTTSPTGRSRARWAIASAPPCGCRTTTASSASSRACPERCASSPRSRPVAPVAEWAAAGAARYA